MTSLPTSSTSPTPSSRPPAAAVPSASLRARPAGRTLHRWLEHWPAYALGMCVALAYFLSSPTAGDFWWFDASRHAMNSVFVHDFFSQGGWKAPISFAKPYYDQYPGINIGFYPPFLYVVTAPFLGLFGVSHAVCQAVVSGFAALTAMAGYAWTRPALGRLGACAAGAVLVLAPEMALWGRQVQLDVPAVALLLWGTWALAAWLEAPRHRLLWLAAALLGCAMLTRVQTLMAWPLWLVLMVGHPVARSQPWRMRLGATVLYGLLSLPSVASAVYFSKVMGNLAGSMPDMPALWSWANWGWYAARFPDQLGRVGMAVLLLGLLLALMLAVVQGITALKHKRAGNSAKAGGVLLRGRVGMALSMAALAWLFFSVVSNKEPRFALPVLPFALLASLLIIGRWPQAWRALFPTRAPTTTATMTTTTTAPTDTDTGTRTSTSTFLILLLAAGMLGEATVIHRWSDVPRVTGHRDAAMVAAALAPSGSRVMISAHRDGNFIFSLRAEGQRPDLAVRRADKLLVNMTIMRQLGIKDRGLNEDDIRALLERERVTVVVAQTGYLADQPSMQALNRLLSSGCCFELRKTVPIEGQHRSDETELRVYVRR